MDELAARLPEHGRINSVGALTLLMPWVESAAVLGATDRAAAPYPVVRQFMGDGAVLSWCHGLVERVAGIAAASGKQWDVAEQHFQSATRLADDLPVVTEQPEARMWYARMLLERGAAGDAERATELLAEARAAYAALENTRQVTMVDQLLEES